MSHVTKHSSVQQGFLFLFSFFAKILKEFCPFPVSFLTGEPRTFYLSQLFPFSSHVLSRTNTKLALCFCADRFNILFQARSHDEYYLTSDNPKTTHVLFSNSIQYYLLLLPCKMVQERNFCIEFSKCKHPVNSIAGSEP